jgi:hypothetical protein
MLSEPAPVYLRRSIATAPFQSILYERGGGLAGDAPPQEPPYFGDLHLDDIVAAVTGGKDQPEIARVFSEPLRDVAAITYRHDVFRDLEDADLLDAVRSFCRAMDTVRRRLGHSSKGRYEVDMDRWLLSSADAFRIAVDDLCERLRPASPHSAALAGFRTYLADYVEAESFTALVADTARVKCALEEVSYRLRIHGPKVTVSRVRPEPDLGAEVLAAFAKFRQTEGHKAYDWRFDEGSDMNHVEAAILERVMRLHPGPFAALGEFGRRHRGYLDPTIDRFDREVRFYLAWIDFITPIRDAAGLRFSYPEVSAGSRTVKAVATFDLALAASLLETGGRVVPNDVELRDGERVVVVSGPNQGGKTTLARAVGQIHHLARIGVPVPGRQVVVPLVDRIFTHFERRERVEDLSSKLEDDLRRIRAILAEATRDSLLVMNESFTSTTVDDQRFIGRQVMRQVLDRGALCLIVTFLDELAALGPSVVSMVATVDPGDTSRRTFTIVRRPPDGLAYALAIAARHDLLYENVKARLAR